MDSSFRSRRLSPPLKSRIRGEDSQIPNGGQKQPPLGMVLASKTKQGGDGVHHSRPHTDWLQRTQCTKQTAPPLEGS